MYSDSHCHTSFSSDSETAPEKQIRQAIRLGMEQLTITDHYDMDFPPGDLDFIFDPAPYFQTLEKLREKYADRIRLVIGVELGLQPHLAKELPAFTAAWPFEFIIGSTHLLDRIDPYYTDQMMQGRTEEQAYRTYFEGELENLRVLDCYDVAGHLDFVVRYGPSRNRFYTWERYGDILEEILRILISKGKGLEVNTAGFRNDLGEPNPMSSVLARYRELGGEILTIGSDAHVAEDLGSHFGELKDLLTGLGFRYYTVFRDRKPVFLPL